MKKLISTALAASVFLNAIGSTIQTAAFAVPPVQKIEARGSGR